MHVLIEKEVRHAAHLFMELDGGFLDGTAAFLAPVLYWR